MYLKSSNKIFITVAIILLVVASIGLVATCEYMYTTAFDLIDNGDYTGAYEKLEKLGKYRNADSELAKFHYVPVGETITVTKDGESSIQATVTFRLNDKNLPSVINVLTDDYERKIEYTYDENGNVTKIITNDPRSGQTVDEYIYDDQKILSRAPRPTPTANSSFKNSPMIRAVTRSQKSAPNPMVSGWSENILTTMTATSYSRCEMTTANKLNTSTRMMRAKIACV